LSLATLVSACVYLAKGSVYRCDKEVVCSAAMEIQQIQTKSEQTAEPTTTTTTHLMRPLGQQVKMKLFVWVSPRFTGGLGVARYGNRQLGVDR